MYHKVNRLRSFLSSGHSGYSGHLGHSGHSGQFGPSGHLGHSGHSGHLGIIFNIFNDRLTNNIRTYIIQVCFADNNVHKALADVLDNNDSSLVQFED